jgi:FKBP-type peptidyl-prolyl cis-trans isomerase
MKGWARMKVFCSITFIALGVIAMSANAGQAEKQEKVLEKPVGKSVLKYVELTEGKGKEAKAGNNVEVHYTGWLTNGKKFDSSLDAKMTFEFTLGAGRVIKGWDEGVAGMKEGGKRKLIVPPELGYGSKGFPGVIPPDSTLIFEVELIKVK